MGMPKGLSVGVSSGMFMAADAAEKQAYLTIPRKLFYAAMKGVNFTQMDLESITEFGEPGLVEGVKKIKEMGMTFGIHAESYAMGGTEKPISMLDSAIETEYEHAHLRLKEHLDGCIKIGAEYLLIHSSESTAFVRLGMHLQPVRVVDPWGRPMSEFLDENPKIFNWAIHYKPLIEVCRPRMTDYDFFYERLVENFKRDNEKREPNGEEEKEIKKIATEHAKDEMKRYLSSGDMSYGAERIAYYIIAKWMQDNKDSLWQNIVGRKIPENDFPLLKNYKDWVPAVSAKYVAGHFKPKDSRYFDPLKIIEKNKLVFVFETPMGGSGIEGLQRLSRPRDMYYLSKEIGSPLIGFAMDFEHMLGAKIDPQKEIESLPKGAAEKCFVMHLGFPTPHNPAHIPLALGSPEQLWIYKRLWELRQKGQKNAWFIFERGGGPDPVKQSVVVIRNLVKYLEKNVEPMKLPEEFYGFPPGGPNVKLQELAMRDHFLDPLKGLLSVSEEEYTFLGKTVAEKPRGAEKWPKERYR